MYKGASEATIARVLAFLKTHGDHSSVGLQSSLGLSRTTASHVMSVLHRRGCTHIARFEPIPGNSKRRAIYRYGPGVDATYSSNFPGKRDYLEEERIWLAASKSSGSVLFRHPQDIALFGEYRPARHSSNQPSLGERA